MILSRLLRWARMRRHDLIRGPRLLLWAMPVRLVRLARAARGRPAPGSLAGERAAHRLPPAVDRLHRILVALFDLLGGPETAQFAMHLGMNVSPLSPPEVATLSAVLGPEAIDYDAVRVATGGVLSLVFRLNGGRAFATWHTIHLPPGKRSDLSLLVHEATHVYQYEQLGSAYIGEALYAQRRLGRACYDYGGPAGLGTGAPYHAFNREAQAQIAQDYCRRLTAGEETAPYLPYVAELRGARF